MLGKVLSNRYKILEKVGAGGMALVYKAKDMLLGRLVAVKVLREQYAGDREFVERFRREAQAAASLSHANVVNIYDVGQEDDVYFIVMEYVEGRNLKDIIRRQSIPLGTAVHIAQQVAMALEHAHRHHLVHRDIKPHNIIITEDNQVKVTDFGIALAASYSELTQTGFVMGTAQYFSPEQARGGMATKQSDLYSLGVLLYEMLTGTLPFTGDTPVAIALQHVQEPIKPPRQLNPSIPRELDRIVVKALAKDLKERYQTASEMLQDLQRVAESLTTTGRHPGMASPEVEATTLIESVAETTGRTMIHRLGDETKAQTRIRDEEPPKETRPVRRKGRVRSIVLLSLLFIGLLIWGATKIPQLIFPEEVVVPNVVGRTQNEARELLERHGLKLAVEREVYSTEAPAGQVLNQDPSPNRRIKMYRTVFVTVSKGPRMVEVPSLVGLTVRDARLRITQAGLVVGIETPVVGVEAPLDQVIAQEPQAGSYLEEGSAVNISVSSERVTTGNLTLPDFRNMTLEASKERLAELGLVLGNAWGDTSISIPRWHIISQNPAPGTTVAPGDTVDFVYSLGRPGTQLHEDQGHGIEEPDDEDRDEEPGQGAVEEAPQEPELPIEPSGREDEQLPPQDQIGEPEPQQPETEAEEELEARETTGGEPSFQQAEVQVVIPPGPDTEVVILVIDDLGAREAYRGVHKGGSVVTRQVSGQGGDARIQVYIGNRLVSEQAFP